MIKKEKMNNQNQHTPVGANDTPQIGNRKFDVGKNQVKPSSNQPNKAIYPSNAIAKDPIANPGIGNRPSQNQAPLKKTTATQFGGMGKLYQNSASVSKTNSNTPRQAKAGPSQKPTQVVNAVVKPLKLPQSATSGSSINPTLPRSVVKPTPIKTFPEGRTKLRVIPLGGLGEIGKNMTVFEYGNEILVVDCGLMFPTEEMMGIDLVIPDVSYLEERQDKIKAIVITHGHEDHIGALAYVLPQLGFPPVYASKLACGLIGAKVREGTQETRRKLVINTLDPGQKVDLGVFKVEAFSVCHSIPDSCGLAISTPVGKIIHTGDFKIDYTPVDGKPSDLGILARTCQDGVLLLMSDSTHVELDGYTASERMIGVTIDRIMNDANGRIIITTFASLISRIQLVIKAAEKYNRKVFLAGRGMLDNVKIATELGYLKAKSDTIVPIEEIRNYKPKQITMITTGSQGEPTSALVKIANKDHRQISIIPGDTVVLSSSPIPGNESLVNRTIDSLFKQGANVIYNRLEKVHVHGHASKEELKMMLTVVKPKFFMPIHGEFRHLKLHADLARSLGMPKENVFAMEDGEVLELTSSTAKVNAKIAVGNVYVDGLSVGDIGSAVIRSRQQLSQDGIVVAMIAISPSGTLVRRPDIISLGFVDIHNGGQEIIEDSKELIIRTVHGAQIKDYGALPSKLRDVLSNFYYAQTKRHPMVMPMVINV